MVSDQLREDLNTWRTIVRQLRREDLHQESIILMLLDEAEFARFASSEALKAVEKVTSPTNLILTRAIRRILIPRLQAEITGMEERERMDGQYADRPCL